MQSHSDLTGEIYKLNILGKTQYVVSTVELVNELCDEKRFQKSIQGSLYEARAAAGNGLFTAFNHERNWHLAHKILIPAFGPIGISNSFDEMQDIAMQLVSKWARTTDRIDVSADFTRLTLDSIALCAMNKRFDSFYSEKMHPFVDAMINVLVETGARETRTKLESALRRGKNRRYQQNISLMRSLAQEMVQHRRTHPSPKKDLLNAMILGKTATGEQLDDKSIIDNMITFPIAGHETTSGLLSFTFYYLLKNPETMLKAQAEIDSVIGKSPVTLEHMSKLPYIEAVLRESLRLSPTAPAFGLEVKGSTPEILGGKYIIPVGSPVFALLPMVHRDPMVYGEDADEFRPERMYGQAFEDLPPNSWKPFGNGARGCIGRGFAWQEAILSMALILQHFDIQLDDPSYQLRIKETLTIKPDGLFIRTSFREGIDALDVERRVSVSTSRESQREPSAPFPTGSFSGPKKPITVLYGSNSGTCEGLAHSFASNAVNYGYEAKVKLMDSVVHHLPSNQPVLIITSSYEGQPPDNASAFVQWIKTESTDLRNVKYAVFGCGHHDWAATYQLIPKLVDQELENRGATRIAGRGETDVGRGKLFNDFDYWQDEIFWSQVGSCKKSGLQEAMDIRISTTTRASHLNYNVQDALVLSNKALASSGGVKEKRHIELRLPTSLSYQAGDYLAILPMNDQKLVWRVLRRFELPWDAVMTLEGGSHSFIPVGTETPVSSVLESYIELNTPATNNNIATIVAFASGEGSIDQKLAADFVKGGTSPSVLDILENHPEIKLPFSVFLSMMPPMRIRQYSISSSPLIDPTVASITFSLANRDVQHPGVATTYLKYLEPGSRIHVIVKKSHAAFHPPLDDKTPIIMTCAGSGIAPFRGFIQERVVKIENGKKNLGPAILFVGCQAPNVDKLFAKELDRAEELRAVKVYYAYSQASEQSEGCRYIQDRIRKEWQEVRELFDNKKARAYMCGSSVMGRGVLDVVVEKTLQDEDGNKTEAEVREWWETMRNERYAVDVFD